MLPGPTGPTPVGPTGPFAPSMSAGHTDVPMPPGYVPTAEEQQNGIPKSQTSWKPVEMLRLVEILLLQWAWLKSWFDLVVYGLKLFEKFDIKFLAPTVVIVVGIVMTNVLGFINFFLQGLHLDACMAAFDLDTPFLAWKHGAQVVKGEDCPEWEKLRMRNSIWRSLPLAMITLVLSLRNLFEIPICQIFALPGPIATSIVPELEENDSRFIQDIRNVTNYSAIGVVRAIHEASSRIRTDQKERFRPTGELLLELENDVWDAAHCSDSTWEETRMLQDQDTSEHWALGRPVNLEQVKFGGIGSGNLASFNAIFFEQWVSEVERRGDEIKRHLKRESFWTTVGIYVLPFGTVLRNGIQSLDAWKGNAPRITVEQHRPWKLTIGDLVTVQIKFGWKVGVLQACGLSSAYPEEDFSSLPGAPRPAIR